MAEIKSKADIEAQINTLKKQKAILEGQMNIHPMFKKLLAGALNSITDQIKTLEQSLAVANAVANQAEAVADHIKDIGSKIGNLFGKKDQDEQPEEEQPEQSTASAIGDGVQEALTPGEDGEIDPMAATAVNTGGSIALGALKSKIDEIKGWEPKQLMAPIDKGISVNFVFITGNLDFKATLEADWTVDTVKPMSGPVESWGAVVGAGIIGRGSITASVGGGLSLGPFDLFKLTFGIFGQITVFGGPKVTLTMDAATNSLLGASGTLAIEVSCQAGPAIGFHCDILPKKCLYEAVEKANDKFFAGKFQPYQNELRLTALDKKILIVTLGSVSVTVDTAKGFSFSMKVSGPSIKLHPALKSMIDGWIQKVKDGIRALLDLLNQAWKVVKEAYVDAGWEYSAWGGGMF